MKKNELRDLADVIQKVTDFGKGDLKPTTLKAKLSAADEAIVHSCIKSLGLRPEGQDIEQDNTFRLEYEYARIPWITPSNHNPSFTSTFVLSDPRVALISFAESITLGNVIEVAGFSSFDNNHPHEVLGTIFKAPEYSYTLDLNPHDRDEPFHTVLTTLSPSLRPLRELDLGMDQVLRRSFRFQTLIVENNYSGRVFKT